MTDEYRFLRYDVSGGIVNRTRPPARQRHPRSHDGRVLRRTRACRSHDVVKVLIFRGEERFSAGADLRYLEAFGTGNG